MQLLPESELFSNVGMESTQDLLIKWNGVDWPLILSFAVMYEMFYQCSKHVISRRFSEFPKVVTYGASYLAAFVNAAICSAAGIWVVVSLLHGNNESARLVVQPGENATQVAFLTAKMFLGYLLYDVVHIVTHWPALGGFDMLLHHIGFATLATIGSGFRYCPFVVGWTLSGECSSLFLNYRWYLISTGRGNSRALSRTNALFAISFFLFRVAIFWAGVIHVLLSERPKLVAPPYSAPAWSANLLTSFLVGGAALNAFWFVKIVIMARRPVAQSESSKMSEKCALAAIQRDSSMETLSDVEGSVAV